MRSGPPALVVAAAQSGAGKTTATMALIAGLRRRGLEVQPFKVGPDYLDPGLLSWASGRPCRNLDAWMVAPDHLLELFHRACQGADVAVVEGVMGLFDGRAGAGDEASTAAVARLLGAPVLLLVDAGRSARTTAAVALGLARADSRLEVAGVVVNRVSSERHLETCRDGLAALGLPFLGSLIRDPAITLPDRYLGLISPAESPPPRGLRRALEKAALGLDLDALLRAAQPAEAPVDSCLFPPAPIQPRVRVALARDRAFHFYYQDSLDLLQAWGAELVSFSPLEDRHVPPAQAVVIGGGYPELFASELASNRPLLRSLRQAHAAGALVYAECGGAMYASLGIETAEGARHRLVGLWPAWVSLRQRRLTVGYRRVRSLASGFLTGWELPAHEFHHSSLRSSRRPLTPAWQILDAPTGQGGDRTEGCSSGRLVASYIHLHLASSPGLAAAFVEACAGSR